MLVSESWRTGLQMSQTTTNQSNEINYLSRDVSMRVGKQSSYVASMVTQIYKIQLEIWVVPSPEFWPTHLP